MHKSPNLISKIATAILAIALFSSSLPIQAEKSYQAVPIKQIHANPINIASRLIFQQDSAAVASTLEYYGYTPGNSELHNATRITQNENGKAIFSHTDGTTILFSFPNTEEKHTHPTVQVYSKTTRPQTEKILSELDFKKNGDHYENIMSNYSQYLTKCTFGPGNSVTFERKKK